MLTRKSSLAPQNDFYNDNISSAPSILRSSYDNLAAGFATPVADIQSLNGQYGKTPEGQAIKSTMDAADKDNAAPQGWPQWMANKAAGMIGYGLNPINWLAAGEGIGLASRGVEAISKVTPDAVGAIARSPLKDLVSQPLKKYIPETIGTELGEQPLSASVMGEATLKSFGKWTGFGLSQAVYDNFNHDSNHINWGGVAHDASQMGAYGLGIDSIPYAWGLLRGKINRGMGRSADAHVDNSALTQSLQDGRITQDEHDWFSDFTAAKANPKANADKLIELRDKATQLVSDEGHTVNSETHEVQFNIVNPETINHLQGALADEATADMPDEYKNALSDYMIHNDLDKLTADPAKLDGVRGYVDSIDEKLAGKDAKLAEADEILDKHLTKGMTDSMPMSQKEMVKAIRKSGLNSDHVKNLPISIPENVITYTKRLKSIDDLKSANRKLFRKFKRTGDNQHVEKMKVNDEKIKDIENGLNGKTYFRGVPKNKFGFKTLEEAGVKEEDLRQDDLELGKGYWFSETETLAKKYGDEIHTAHGDFKVYDLDSGKDLEINNLYKELHNRRISGEILKHPKPKGYITTPELINRLQEKLQSKGYVGVRRFGNTGMDSGYHEVMFFEKPKGFKKQGILTPKEELQSLRQELLSPEGRKMNPAQLQRSVAYQRLLDLSNVWHNARTLLDRVHLEHEYNRQEAYKTVASHVVNVSDSNLPALAKPENVMDYLKARIEAKIKKTEDISDVKADLKRYEDIPADSESVLKSQEESVKKTSAENARAEFDDTFKKYKDFKSSPNIFKNLISCVMGARNV